MTKQTDINRVWEVVEKVGVCMMTTRFSEGLRARPLEAKADRDARAIWFLTDRRAAKDDEIEDLPEICLTFVYPKEKVYPPRCPERHQWAGIQSALGLSGMNTSEGDFRSFD